MLLLLIIDSMILLPRSPSIRFLSLHLSKQGSVSVPWTCSSVVTFQKVRPSFAWEKSERDSSSRSKETSKCLLAENRYRLLKTLLSLERRV